MCETANDQASPLRRQVGRKWLKGIVHDGWPVKPAPVSEKEEAAVEGRRMVAELDDFEAGR